MTPHINFPIIAERRDGFWAAARLIMSVSGRISLLEVFGCATFSEAMEKMESMT
jgi:hypothetical protein